jgi:hypothetical protein
MEKNGGRDVKVINYVAEEVLCIKKPANKGMWFHDDECQAAIEDKKKNI